ncbi:unnamed protein product [Durusdinium trenchii]|uniref:SLC26A/SulP transporter domain-containing protein n=1 Tax=Durusdinium trenchii TaxID=1381693 RepID=A0ABP0PX43_9DINO
MPRYISDVKAWSMGDVVAGPGLRLAVRCGPPSSPYGPGVTVAVTSLPQYIAYAELAQLSGFRGEPVSRTRIVASGPPLVAFAFLTGNPCLNIGARILRLEQRGEGEYRDAYGEAAWSQILGTYSMMIGVASLALALLNAGSLVKHIPAPVKAGWKLGFALAACAAQMPNSAFEHAKNLKKICQLPNFRGAPLQSGAANMYRLAWSLTHPHFWDAEAVAFSAMTLFIVMYFKSPLKVIVASALGAGISYLRSYSGDVVGRPPPGSELRITGELGVAWASNADLTSWVHQWPWEMPLEPRDETVNRLGGWPLAVMSAVAFAFVDYLAIISVEAERPAPGGSRPNREMAGQGLGCIASGMGGSAPIGGSLTRSMLAGMIGCLATLMGLVCGLVTMCLGFPMIATLLEPTPKAVLSSTVLAAVLPAVVAPKDLLRLKGSDALVGWVSAAGTCLTDPTKGFGMGCAFYFFIYGLRKSTKTHPK